VDELGNVDDAIAEAAKLAGLDDDYDVRWMEQELDWSDELVKHLRGGVARVIESLTPGRAALSLAPALENARALLALIAEGRPVYLCSCRVE
jgi:ClpP class serine protease